MLRHFSSKQNFFRKALPIQSFLSHSNYFSTSTSRNSGDQNIYDVPYLKKREANHEPLSPLSFLKRTAAVHPNQTSVVYGEDFHLTYKESLIRARKIASRLKDIGIKKGDTVSVMAPNTPSTFELHFAVPGLQAVLNTLNTRLDPRLIAFQLQHGESKVLFTDTEHSDVIREALKIVEAEGGHVPVVIDILDPYLHGSYKGTGKNELLGITDYETFLEEGNENFRLINPDDEYDPIALNYTSGTTGNPKGVVTHHRGAYLNAVANLLSWGMDHHSSFLHIVPLFHCNGWCFPWAITSIGGKNVFTRYVREDLIYSSIINEHVTHMNGAPIVMSSLLSGDPKRKQEVCDIVNQYLDGKCVKMMTAGSAPPPSVIKQCQEELGIDCVTAYGLTETYGPSTIHVPPLNSFSESTSEVGNKDHPSTLPSVVQWQTNNILLEDVMVGDPDTLLPVADDGEQMGEVFIRGNIVMNGYLKNEKATEECFKGGWFHSGDLGVSFGKGRFMLRDRSKDLVISGGENISSQEVESIMYAHPAIQEVAVVAAPDEKWGEVPWAFVGLKKDKAGTVTEEEIITWLKERIARYKVPKKILFGELPKTATGKIQKFQLRKRVEQEEL